MAKAPVEWQKEVGSYVQNVTKEIYRMYYLPMIVEVDVVVVVDV